MKKQPQKNEIVRYSELPTELAERGREVWLAGLGAVATVEEEGARFINTLEVESTRLFKELVERGKKVEARGKKRIEEAVDEVYARQRELANLFTGTVNKTVGQLETTLSGTTEKTLERLDVPSRSEIQDLTKKVEALSKQVDVLAAALGKQRTAATRPEVKPAPKAAPARTVYHVVPHGEGWAVKLEGGERAVSVHDLKEEAVERGRELAKGREPSRLVVHRKDGTIQDSNMYGQ